MTSIQQKIKDPDNSLTEEVLTLRKHRWDEEDRLRGVDLMPDNDPNRPEIASYTYDASGERVVRYVPGRLEAFYNASNTGFSDRLESFVYPSGLLTAKTLKGMNINKQIMTYTKHYYIGAERISSVIGTGNSVGYNICISDFPSSSDLAEMNQKVTQAGQALQNDYDYFEKQLSLSQPFSTRPSCGTSYIGTEMPYWFHPDHLGSSSYISNLSGEISQHLEYLPFGETLVEEHKNSNNSPYKFNAKELDDETGNYYYGARYLNPKWSFWLSVDPLAENYHGWSPYNYTLLNPVKLIDPDGRSVEDPPTKKGIKTGDTFYDRDNTELYTWNNNDGVWQGDKGSFTMILDEAVITASSKKSGISSFFDRLFSFFTPSKNARGLELYYSGGNGNNGMYVPKGKGGVPVDVDEFLDNVIIPGGVPSTSTLVNMLQFDATYLNALSQADPLSNILNKREPENKLTEKVNVPKIGGYRIYGKSLKYEQKDTSVYRIDSLKYMDKFKKASKRMDSILRQQ